MNPLDRLNFVNSFARLPDTFHSRLSPTPLPAPYLVSFNPAAAALIDLDDKEALRGDFAEYFSGNRLLPGSEPLSMLYSGHQFGHYVPQLGDGRAILLGEIKNRSGETWEVQLKGAGVTPYSRQGDGRAVLRSSIREYLCSDAMHGLGIPTTRALCIVGSDEEIYREKIESAAVVTRLAPTHVRFGSFEVFYYRQQAEPIAALADYVIDRHFAHLGNKPVGGEPDRYARFLAEVVTRTARLMAQWQAVGFAHGVMNTDNMSILGLTFDYGPFGFMDAYDPGFICNHSDHEGRYAFDQQPYIGLWNLSCLAQAMTPIIPAEEAQAMLDSYPAQFEAHYLDLMVAKLGLSQPKENDIETDKRLVGGLLALMKAGRVDYTRFFRSLGQFDSLPGSQNPALRDQFIDRPGFDAWAETYRARLTQENSIDSERQSRMDRVNPKYILRNYLAQIAIEKAVTQRDYSEIDRLLALLSRPFDEQPEMERYAALPPEWAQQISVSCSS